MKAFSYFKVDCLRCKTQLILVAVMMIFFGFFFTFNGKDVTFAYGYLSFLAVMFSVQPFAMDQKIESGFIDMLPGKTSDRVHGRFLYSLMVISASIIIGIFTIAVYKACGKTFDSTDWAVYMALIGAAFFFVSIEIIILYSLGKGRSQQFMTVAMIVPGFLMFFGVGLLADYITDHPEIDISWIIEHQNSVATGVLALGLLFFIIAMQISKVIIRKRDFE